jgi:putative redox protein
MLTIMGIAARTLNLDISGATASVDKEMTATPPRRIARLTVRVHVPHLLTPIDREKLERAAHACPVYKSLHPYIQVPIEFTWG